MIAVSIRRACRAAAPGIAFALAVGCAVNPATGGRDLVFMSQEQEIALGRQYHPQIIQAYGQTEDPALQAYVQQVGERLAERSHRRELIYRFTVLDSDEVNAFALPGGYIYVTRGILAYLQSEAELAAVLGHEIAHVTARHSVRQHATSTLVGVLGTVAAASVGTRAAFDLANLFGGALVSGYGRNLELEADRFGAEYLAGADYPPQAMLEVLSVLKDQELFEIERARAEKRKPRVYHGVFATHPDADTRLQEVVEAAETLVPPGEPMVGREPYLYALEGLAYGKSRRQGILRDRRFYHAELGIAMAFPAGWRVENLPDRLLAYAPDNRSLLQVTLEDRNLRIPPREFMLRRLKLSRLEHEVTLDVGGLDAHAAVATLGDTPWGKRPTRFTVIYQADRAFVFAGASDMVMDGRPSADPAFLASAESFHPLRPEEMALAEPSVIRIRETQPGDTIARLVETSPLTNYPQQQLRLINDLYPDREPVPGSLIKVIE